MFTPSKCPNDSPNPSPKRQRKELTLNEKVDLIEHSEKTPKITQKDLGVKFGIGKTTVSDILKRKEFYREQFKISGSGKRQRFIIGSKYGNLNEAVFKWFEQARAKNIPISGPIIQEKALQFASELDFPDFKASVGWLESFKSRFNIAHFKICGESADVNLDVVNSYKDVLKQKLDGYEPRDIFNCDETGLFFRALPDKSFSVKGKDCKGGKLAKERVTVMLACSMLGEKVIGKSSRPRCFKNLDLKKFPVTWRNNKKSWMSSEIFSEWITDINDKMRKKQRQIIMFLDNATVHRNIKLSHVKLEFFPANTTSKLQPLDLGIIRAMKARYRKNLMRRLLAGIETSANASELSKKKYLC